MKSFSEDEVFLALSWGMPESEARRLAPWMSDDPSVAAKVPNIRELGPTEHMYAEGLLLLLSFVSAETNEKVEAHLLERRLGVPLTASERSDWERRRAQLRDELVKAGKLRSEV
jgi:hypothetical protein